MSDVTREEVDALYRTLDREAEGAGYHLNPDADFTRDLIEGLIVNEKRYGYRSCPCRLASGDADDDRDMVCPCDYRDVDLDEYGACYCALYVSAAVKAGEAELKPVPERRPPTAEERRRARLRPAGTLVAGEPRSSFPVWRCNVCGYLCARDTPPGVCPICKAKRDRFERFS